MRIEQQSNAFIYRQDNGRKGGEITFQRQHDNIIIADHTHLDPALRGQGIAAKLLAALAEYARSNRLKIKAHCNYVARTFAHNDHYQDVNADAE